MLELMQNCFVDCEGAFSIDWIPVLYPIHLRPDPPPHLPLTLAFTDPEPDAVGYKFVVDNIIPNYGGDFLNFGKKKWTVDFTWLLLVQRPSDRVVGMAALTEDHYMTNLCVSAAMRRKGLARRLIQNLVQFMRSNRPETSCVWWVWGLSPLLILPPPPFFLLILELHDLLNRKLITRCDVWSSKKSVLNLYRGVGWTPCDPKILKKAKDIPYRWTMGRSGATLLDDTARTFFRRDLDSWL